jgi:hypothetical protein
VPGHVIAKAAPVIRNAQITGAVPCTKKGTHQKASELHIDCRKDCSQVSEKIDMHAKDDHTCIALDLLEPSVHA